MPAQLHYCIHVENLNNGSITVSPSLSHENENEQLGQVNLTPVYILMRPESEAKLRNE